MNVGDQVVTIYGGSKVKLVRCTQQAGIQHDFGEVSARWMVEYANGDQVEFSTKELKAA